MQDIMFLYVLMPLSATMTALSAPRLSLKPLTIGLKVSQSLVLPGKSRYAMGMESWSIIRPIWTIGSGLCSLLTPLFLRSSSLSSSK